ncbi:MAG: malto-oligosyltrehalose synthase [Pseudohongiellaceae bacterium]
MTRPAIPRATYRLQFNRDFTFNDAAAIVTYLRELGISHIYASPFFKARPGSSHGYDIIDHNQLNPELGAEPDFEKLVSRLHENEMGQIVDIVPNHMFVGGSENVWWYDVLQHGEASAFADFFDINWHPVNSKLQNKLLLPFLGDHYGIVLEQGDLRLECDWADGNFYVSYFDHRFPLDPRTWPQIFRERSLLFKLRAEAGSEPERRFLALLNQCAAIPRRTALPASQKRYRWQAAEQCRRELARLNRDHPAFARELGQTASQFNGVPGEPDSFDRLHRLLERQAYRLAFWKVAADEINYRRFFDINELAGLRMENPDVFTMTHRRIGELLATRQIDGVRIDHVDGLANPGNYFLSLKQLIERTETRFNPAPYIVVEKILASYEHLPTDWPVNGTTGYDFASLVNGLFVNPAGESQLSRVYRRFTRTTSGVNSDETVRWNADFDECLYQSRKFIIRHALTSGLTVLANRLSSIAGADRRTRDFTYQGLRDALGEVVACFPVYRTYITPENIREDDRHFVNWAVDWGERQSPAGPIIFKFIRGILLLDDFADRPVSLRYRITAFNLRFQQYTSMVAAKGMEDTAFYRYQRLISLNDVGFDPRDFGTSTAGFHHENGRRLECWPHAMLTTSTHDSKRSEDVRARINVLSEIPDIWRRHVLRWRWLNRGKRKFVDNGKAPTRSDEYLLYQTMVGMWPLLPPDEYELPALINRINAYMVKAAREAKQRTSWSNPNTEYEQGMEEFIKTLLGTSRNNAFLADFDSLHQRVARFGLLNSLSQILLKLTSPGVPDIYQGNELWVMNLVDPDNRHAVDYNRRRVVLRELRDQMQDSSSRVHLLRELLKTAVDGRAKLYVTLVALDARRRHENLFATGEYYGMTVQGTQSDKLCAFARVHNGQVVIVAAGRWFVLLTGGLSRVPDGEDWVGTWLILPESIEARRFTNLLTNERVEAGPHEEFCGFAVQDLLSDFPVALLASEP